MLKVIACGLILESGQSNEMPIKAERLLRCRWELGCRSLTIDRGSFVMVGGGGKRNRVCRTMKMRVGIRDGK